jgi:hypothetical protein
MASLKSRERYGSSSVENRACGGLVAPEVRTWYKFLTLESMMRQGGGNAESRTGIELRPHQLVRGGLPTLL